MKKNSNERSASGGQRGWEGRGRGRRSRMLVEARPADVEAALRGTPVGRPGTGDRRRTRQVADGRFIWQDVGVDDTYGSRTASVRNV